MDRIELTPEMRERVLANVEHELQGRSARRPFALRRVLVLAACLALVIAAAVALPPLAYPDVESRPGIEAVRDVSELSDAVGFEVREPAGLPFEVETAEYVDYSGLAQITCSGEGESAVYRKAEGTDSVSGDYSQYEAVAHLAVSGVTVTVKGGAEDEYTLAEWTKDGFSYSLSLTVPLSSGEWTALLEANIDA